jgi:1-pyrroline-5-carboxylate dehydrogenase
VPTEPLNEPVLGYAPGSKERELLRAELSRQSAAPVRVPLRLGVGPSAGEGSASIRAPHRHSLELGEFAVASRRDVDAAIAGALAARSSWAGRTQEERSAVFRRAAELLSGPHRARVNAATMLGQSKTPHQAEIDAACELSDFFRFNAYFAERLGEERLISLPSEQNRFDFRPLEGFVYAVTPFNFTAIAGNLPTVAALLGNVVLWKPSPYAMLSAHYVYELLLEAGLPEGVITLVAGDAQEISAVALAHSELAGVHFTGSTQVFESISAEVGARLGAYRNYPRIVGETGGKGFIVAHSSAELEALAVAIVRGAFEYQGQKCSAATRVYLPRSLAARLEARLVELVAQIKIGDPSDFSNFMGAVISRSAFQRLSSAIERARADAECRVVLGGGSDDREGFFIEPTVIEVKNAAHRLLAEELFGPIVTTLVYDDDRFEDVLSAVNSGSAYGLTGAIFARERAAIERASEGLRYAAGNFYVNDKPTGAVVGQQPFGGARHSGTNDKAGAAFHLFRWLSPRVIKENLSPPTALGYPYLLPDPDMTKTPGTSA